MGQAVWHCGGKRATLGATFAPAMPQLEPRTSPESPLAALTHSFRLQNAQNLNFQTTHPKKYLKLAGSYPDFFELLTA